MFCVHMTVLMLVASQNLAIFPQIYKLTLPWPRSTKTKKQKTKQNLAKGLSIDHQFCLHFPSTTKSQTKLNDPCFAHGIDC